MWRCGPNRWGWTAAERCPCHTDWEAGGHPCRRQQLRNMRTAPCACPAGGARAAMQHRPGGGRGLRVARRHAAAAQLPQPDLASALRRVAPGAASRAQRAMALPGLRAQPPHVQAGEGRAGHVAEASGCLLAGRPGGNAAPAPAERCIPCLRPVAVCLFPRAVVPEPRHVPERVCSVCVSRTLHRPGVAPVSARPPARRHACHAGAGCRSTPLLARAGMRHACDAVQPCMHLPVLPAGSTTLWPQA